MNETKKIREALLATIRQSIYYFEVNAVVSGSPLNITHGYCDINASQMVAETSVVKANPKGLPSREVTLSYLDVTKVIIEKPGQDHSSSDEIGYVSFESLGIVSSQIWLLFWLYAVTEAKEVNENKFQVVIKPEVFQEQAPVKWAKRLGEALDQSALAQQPGPYYGQVTLSTEGLIETFSLYVPHGDEEEFNPETDATKDDVVHVLRLQPTKTKQLEFPESEELQI
ncbi:MAG: hypothetical protein QM613_06300 [Micrococcaceae bacterium]